MLSFIRKPTAQHAAALAARIAHLERVDTDALFGRCGRRARTVPDSR